MVHEIFQALSEGKEIRFCWRIHVTAQFNGDVLKTIACLDSDVNEAAKPEIEGTPL